LNKLTIKANCCGLPQIENQQGRKFNEICQVYRCKCKKAAKVWSIMIRKVANKQKMQDPFLFVGVWFWCLRCF